MTCLKLIKLTGLRICSMLHVTDVAGRQLHISVRHGTGSLGRWVTKCDPVPCLISVRSQPSLRHDAVVTWHDMIAHCLNVVKWLPTKHILARSRFQRVHIVVTGRKRLNIYFWFVKNKQQNASVALVTADVFRDYENLVEFLISSSDLPPRIGMSGGLVTTTTATLQNETRKCCSGRRPSVQAYIGLRHVQQ